MIFRIPQLKFVVLFNVDGIVSPNTPLIEVELSRLLVGVTCALADA